MKSEAEDEEDEAAEDIELTDSRWFSHELRAESTDPVLAKDANINQEEMFDITDPRHPLNQRRRKEDKQKGKMKEDKGQRM